MGSRGRTRMTDDPRPSIWVLMTARAWPIAWSLAVLVVAGLATLARRFGPQLEAAPRERRQLAEHVAATGAFLWRIGCEDTLLAAERQALGRRLGRGRGGDLPAAELKVLAERAAPMDSRQPWCTRSPACHPRQPGPPGHLSRQTPWLLRSLDGHEQSAPRLLCPVGRPGRIPPTAPPSHDSIGG